ALFGDQGPAVVADLARHLGLAEPVLPWHTGRVRIANLGAALATVCGVLGKIGKDIALLMQAEVGEAAEPAAPGRGASSAMAHKRNPVLALTAEVAARRAPGLVATLFAGMVQEHERALGGWQVEWPVLRDLCG